MIIHPLDANLLQYMLAKNVKMGRHNYVKIASEDIVGPFY